MEAVRKRGGETGVESGRGGIASVIMNGITMKGGSTDLGRKSEIESGTTGQGGRDLDQERETEG
jgi:hypothetical protein